MGLMLNWNASTVSRLENGLSRAPAGEVALYLARAKATPAELDELVSLDRRPDDGYLVSAHPPGFPDGLPIIGMLEQQSTSITSYDPAELPHALQIKPYIREVLGHRGYDDQALGAAVRTRLSRLPPSSLASRVFTFYIPESTLHQRGEHPAVARDQMAHLTSVSLLPRCRLHLVPETAALDDIRAGFTLYRHEDHRPVLHHQQPTTSLFLENDADIAFYERYLERVAALALSRAETRDRLDHLSTVKR